MKNKYAMFPFAMGGMALLCFLIVAFFMAREVEPLWGRTLVLLLPSAVLCFVGLLALKGKLDIQKNTILTAALTVVLLVLSLFYVFLLSMWTATTVTTDPAFYERAYAKIDDLECVKACFPAAIPKGASEVKFSYQPQFMQGGEELRLSYIASEGELSERIELLEAAAEWTGTNEEWYAAHGSMANAPEPIRYQLYGEGFANHGEECCVLVERASRKIIFYYSKW